MHYYGTFHEAAAVEDFATAVRESDAMKKMSVLIIDLNTGN